MMVIAIIIRKVLLSSACASYPLFFLDVLTIRHKLLTMTLVKLLLVLVMMLGWARHLNIFFYRSHQLL